MVNNGKYGGGRIMLNPIGFMNDGYFELIFFDRLLSASRALKLLSGVMRGAE